MPGVRRCSKPRRSFPACLEAVRSTCVPPQDLSRYFRDQVLAEAEVQYARE